MKFISAFLRIICGLAVICTAGYVYLLVEDQIQGGGAGGFTIFGQRLNITPDMLLGLIIGAGVIGVLLIIFGILTLLKRKAVGDKGGNA
jgi:hypothetical protein